MGNHLGTSNKYTAIKGVGFKSIFRPCINLEADTTT